MTLLHEAVDEKKLDVRLVERNLNRGSVTADEFEKAVKKLPDDIENAEYVSIETLANDLSEGSGRAH